MEAYLPLGIRDDIREFAQVDREIFQPYGQRRRCLIEGAICFVEIVSSLVNSLPFFSREMISGYVGLNLTLIHPGNDSLRVRRVRTH